MNWIRPVFLIIVFAVSFQVIRAQDTDFLMDERDGNLYLIKKFNNLWWMCQNLKFDAGEGSSCYDEDDNNCLLMGRWYTFDAALNACPEGYRLPGDEDWKALESYVGMNKNDLDKKFNRNSGTVGKFLKADGGLGFDAVYTGFVHPMGRDSYMGTHAYFWTSTTIDETNSWSRVVQDAKQGVDRQVVAKNFSLSVRCVKDVE